MHYAIIGVILNPYNSVLEGHYLKLLILFLPTHLQPALKIIDSQHEITLHVDQLVLCSC